MRRILHSLVPFLLVAAALPSPVVAADLWVTYDGYDGPGKGKHIVLISGDEEYRSEEALSQLGTFRVSLLDGYTRWRACQPG